MRVLVIGATRFIGAYITVKLLKDNQTVVYGVRNADLARRKFSNTEIITCDFNTDTSPEKWYDKLENIDVVINVAGLLVSCGKNKIENVHINDSKALFDALYRL
ncbi:MAG: NAD-dependent epimerase/dehydratase family protein [Rickettsiales endosymbiont of Dermacentor nuttalli]